MSIDGYSTHRDTLREAGPTHNRCKEVAQFLQSGGSRGGGIDPGLEGQVGIHLTGGQRGKGKGTGSYASSPGAWPSLSSLLPTHPDSSVRWVYLNIPILLIWRLRPKRKMNLSRSPRE